MVFNHNFWVSQMSILAEINSQNDTRMLQCSRLKIIKCNRKGEKKENKVKKDIGVVRVHT